MTATEKYLKRKSSNSRLGLELKSDPDEGPSTTEGQKKEKTLRSGRYTERYTLFGFTFTGDGTIPSIPMFGVKGNIIQRCLGLTCSYFCCMSPAC